MHCILDYTRTKHQSHLALEKTRSQSFTVTTPTNHHQGEQSSHNGINHLRHHLFSQPILSSQWLILCGWIAD